MIIIIMKGQLFLFLSEKGYSVLTILFGCIALGVFVFLISEMMKGNSNTYSMIISFVIFVIGILAILYGLKRFRKYRNKELIATDEEIHKNIFYHWPRRSSLFGFFFGIVLILLSFTELAFTFEFFLFFFGIGIVLILIGIYVWRK